MQWFNNAPIFLPNPTVLNRYLEFLLFFGVSSAYSNVCRFLKSANRLLANLCCTAASLRFVREDEGLAQRAHRSKLLL